jgi:hypothetical protein
MGWISEEPPGHEGYIVGLVEEQPGGRWRELRGEDPECRVQRMKVGCDCGWRSRVFHAGLGARWHPSSTELRNDRLEREAQAVWQDHLTDEARREARTGGSGLLMPVDTWT